MAHEYDLSLLELDEIFGWFVDLEGDEQKVFLGVPQSEVPTGDTTDQFGLERLLSDFLVYNWDKTPLGQQHELHVQDGDVAQEYYTPVGRIDLLAKERSTGDWVVIELKRGRSSDVVVGQLLRYLGWVQEHLAGANSLVKGVIIAGDSDERLRYALKPLKGQVILLTYTIQFNMQQVSL